MLFGKINEAVEHVVGIYAINNSCDIGYVGFVLNLIKHSIHAQKRWMLMTKNVNDKRHLVIRIAIQRER